MKEQEFSEHTCMMPPKKTVTVQKATGDSGPLLSDGSDPVQAAVAIVDKKVRNLEKRKVRFTQCHGFILDGSSRLSKQSYLLRGFCQNGIKVYCPPLQRKQNYAIM